MGQNLPHGNSSSTQKMAKFHLQLHFHESLLLFKNFSGSGGEANFSHMERLPLHWCSLVRDVPYLSTPGHDDDGWVFIAVFRPGRSALPGVRAAAL